MPRRLAQDRHHCSVKSDRAGVDEVKAEPSPDFSDEGLFLAA
jgi:hypothetical protein